MKDLVDVPKKVREDLKIIPIQHMDQVLEIALAKEPILSRPVRGASRKNRANQKNSYMHHRNRK